MQQIEWINRTFHFNFPANIFPVIICRLAGAYPRITHIVDDLPEEMLVLNTNDKWSIKEQIGHLIDLEKLHSARIKDFRNKLPVLQAADMSNKTTVQPNHNARHINDLLHEFKFREMNLFPSSFCLATTN